MMIKIPLNVVNHFVLVKQHLAEDSKIDNIVDIVKDVGGLHATASTVPYLSLFSRTKHFTREMLDNELYMKRTMGKIRCVRKTVYILPKELITTSFAAARRMIDPVSEKYSKFLGIKEKEYEESSEKILFILKDRGMTAKEMKKVLRTKLNLSPIVNLMCDKGLLIRGNPKGGWKSNIHTYYLFNDYFPDLNLSKFKEEKARRLLVEQYLASFGPATETDVTWWTGFPKGEIRQIIDELQDKLCLTEILDAKGSHFLLSSQRSRLVSTKPPVKPVINMLPSLDPYLMGYKDRERYLDQKYYNFIFDRTGNATSTILLDGQVVGVWDFAENKESLVKIFFLKKVSDDVEKEVIVKANKMGQFIADKEVQLKKCDFMVPLTQRTAGAVMSPLKNC